MDVTHMNTAMTNTNKYMRLFFQLVLVVLLLLLLLFLPCSLYLFLISATAWVMKLHSPPKGVAVLRLIYSTTKLLELQCFVSERAGANYLFGTPGRHIAVSSNNSRLFDPSLVAATTS